MLAALGSPYIRFAIRLTLITCTISSILALWLGVPLAYLLSRSVSAVANAVSARLTSTWLRITLLLGTSPAWNWISAALANALALANASAASRLSSSARSAS